MPRYTAKRSTPKRATRRKTISKKYTEAEKLAYEMGKIQRGLNNKDSRVYESFCNGLNAKTAKNKKSLY